MSVAWGALAWRWGRLLLLGVVGAWLVLGALAWIFQRRFIYFPDAGPVPVPEGPGWDDLRTIDVRTGDGVNLKAWYLPGATSTTVLVFHGNAGHRGHRADLVQGLARLGLGVLLPDYRGYGGSGGEPSEDGFTADAVACRQWLRERISGPVIYLGSSIGSGVAVELACREPPVALILLSPFSSLRAVAQRALPFLPVGPFLRDRYANIDKVGRLACPLLVVHGEDDDIVPVALGRALFEAAREPKRWISIPRAGHNDLVERGGTLLWAAIASLLKEARSAAGER